MAPICRICNPDSTPARVVASYLEAILVPEQIFLKRKKLTKMNNRLECSLQKITPRELPTSSTDEISAHASYYLQPQGIDLRVTETLRHRIETGEARESAVTRGNNLESRGWEDYQSDVRLADDLPRRRSK